MIKHLQAFDHIDFIQDGPIPEDITWPKQIIVQAGDLMRAFEMETVNIKLVPQDYREIVTQIIDLMLNFGPGGPDSFSLLPDQSRLVSVARGHVSSPADQMTLMRATQNLAHGLFYRIDSLKAWRTTPQGTTLPYYFSAFHNTDLILDHMPF